MSDPSDNIVIDPSSNPVVVDPSSNPVVVDPSDNIVIDPSSNPVVVDPSDNIVIDPSSNPVVVDLSDNIVIDPSSNPVVVDPSDNIVIDPSSNPVVVDPSDNTVIDPSSNPVVVDPSANIFTYTFYDASNNPYVVVPEFRWSVSRMEVVPSLNGLSNIVKNIHWVYYGNVEINGKKYSSYYSDITTLPPPVGDSFLPYENLTPEIVYGWLDSMANVGFARSFIYKNLQNAFNPPIIILPLPF
jgi:hypothetical protein